MGRGVYLLLGFWWPLMVSYPPAGMSTATWWAEDAQGPPGAGLVPSVPMRGLALALGSPCMHSKIRAMQRNESLPKRKGRYAGRKPSGKGIH